MIRVCMYCEPLIYGPLVSHGICRRHLWLRNRECDLNDLNDWLIRRRWWIVGSVVVAGFVASRLS